MSVTVENNTKITSTIVLVEFITVEVPSTVNVEKSNMNTYVGTTLPYFVKGIL